MTIPPKGKLNRQELGWLLTQEAKGAAERLRRGMNVFMGSEPPLPDPYGEAGLDHTLDALDDAVKMLSSLHSKPSTTRGRRRRIDLAALLCEVAPEIRVALSPGSGSEVLGDEAELRRMLHVLVGPGSGAGAGLSLRRDGQEVIVSAALGPDHSVNHETERAWLGRMALRYGGRFEIAGGNECLVLPAYDSEEFLERQAFQRESADSRRAPEFLMRDVLVRGRSEEPGPPPSSILPLQSPMAASQGMAWVFALAGVAKLLRETMAPVGWELLRLRDGLTPRESVGATHGDDLRQALQRVTSVEQKLIPVQELFEELAALADLPQDEFPQAVDLRLAVEGAISHAKSRADRRGVRLRGPERSDGRGDDFFKVVVPPKAMEGVVRWAVASAVVVASPGSTVAATLTVPDDVEASTLVLRVSATGSVSPEAKAASTGDLEVTPQLLSQSGGLELAVLRAMAERYRVPVTVEAGTDGQLRLAIMARR